MISKYHVKFLRQDDEARNVYLDLQFDLPEIIPNVGDLVYLPAIDSEVEVIRRSFEYQTNIGRKLESVEVTIEISAPQPQRDPAGQLPGKDE